MLTRSTGYWIHLEPYPFFWMGSAGVRVRIDSVALGVGAHVILGEGPSALLWVGYRGW